VWQDLYDDLKQHDFTIVAVAMDADVEAARPWIEAASPTYVSLIDREHTVAGLYNMVNVPQAVWIDETGHIVRPTETAGAYEAFRFMNLETREVPAEAAEKRERARAVYYAALRDWAEKGADSRYAFDAAAARAHLPRLSEEAALAQVKFRLGRHLIETGRAEEGEAQIAEAVELHPESWIMFRQQAEKLDNGLAAGAAFWQRVRALGDKYYYPPADMEGMPG
jgi:hypothetical protein